ncbi:MAG: aminodeoxychorismate synthase component I, partial [Gammaproteobacteria bacterium]|nr:aminodeoxychorismate synthase component I [Gammaproteobacteria bacterium]
MLQAVPYLQDSARLFTAIADWPWAVFLDSCVLQSGQGRYDILAAEPQTTIVTRNGETQVSGPEGAKTTTDNPFELLRHALGKDQEQGD